MKSLELNWIRNCDKSLVIPDVFFRPLPDGIGGHYFGPEPAEYLLGNRWVDFRFGVIEINSDIEDHYVATVLAHEWRHHWQVCHGWSDGDKDSAQLSGEDYWDCIYRYFTSYPTEMDCLLFQLKHAPDYWPLEWLNYIRSH